jgi:cytochrome d ubiquinol oxidase subunit II
VIAMTVLITIVTFRIQPQVAVNLSAHRWGYVFPGLAVAGLFLLRWRLAKPTTPQNDRQVFLASSAYLLGMLTSVVFGLYPYVLPASTAQAYSLTVYNAKAGEYGLRIGFVWWVIGMILATGYFVFLYRHFAGKVEVHADHKGY